MNTRPLTYLSLFAGVGGFDLGADKAGWECVAQVEWDKNCQSVLKHRWPNIPKYGDVTDFHANMIPPVDVIVGGFPCQDVSIAGKRAGLGEGTRSGLYQEILRIVKEMRDATANRFPRWVILENVKGLLSVDRGQGFRAVLEDLAATGAYLIEWSLLDSQYFGVPQRRQRVFIAACFDPGVVSRSPDPLFPVSESVPRDFAKGDSSRQELTASVTRSLGSGGADAAHALANLMVPAVADTLGGGSMKRDWPDDTDRMTFVPTTFVKRQRAHSSEDFESWAEGDVAPTVNGFDSGDTRATVAVVDAHNDRVVNNPTTDIVGTLTGGGHPGSYNGQDAYTGLLIPVRERTGDPADDECQNLVIQTPVYGSNWANGGGYGNANEGLGITEEGTGPLPTSQVPTVTRPTGARRLMPLECERLQGWPDNHTAFFADGKPVTDSPRYRMIGNGITANVALWVCQQINRAEQAT